jgi:hypothetical protein
MSGNGKDYLDGFRYGNRRKGFLLIDPFFLSETFSYQSCLEGFNLPIHPSLSLVNTFTTNRYNAVRRLYKRPDIVGILRFQLTLYNFDPVVFIHIINRFVVGTWLSLSASLSFS